MTEREFLDQRAEKIKARIGRRSTAVHDELERAVGPLVRDHPRKSLAAGAAVGVALGAALKPASRVARGSSRGALGFLKGTAAYALRTKMVNSMLSDEDDSEE